MCSIRIFVNQYEPPPIPKLNIDNITSLEESNLFMSRTPLTRVISSYKFIVDLSLTMEKWTNVNSTEKQRILGNFKRKLKEMYINKLSVVYGIELYDLLKSLLKVIQIEVLIIKFKPNAKKNRRFQEVLFKLLRKSKNIIIETSNKGYNFTFETSLFNEIYWKFRKPRKNFSLRFKEMQKTILNIKGKSLTLSPDIDNDMTSYQHKVLRVLPKNFTHLEMSILDLQNLEIKRPSLLFKGFNNRNFSSLKVCFVCFPNSVLGLSYISKCMKTKLEICLKFEPHHTKKNVFLKACILASKVTTQFSLKICDWNSYDHFDKSTLSLLCSKGGKLSKQEHTHQHSEFIDKFSSEMQMFTP